MDANQIIIQSGGQLTILRGYKLTLDDFTQTPLLINAGGILVNNGTQDLQTQLSTTPCEVHGTLENSFNVLTSNNSDIHFFLKETFQKTGGILKNGTGNGSFIILPGAL